MNYRNFSSEIWKTIYETTEKVLQQNKGQKVLAAFDADGTLWDTDHGENFFQYQIDHRLVDLPQDPWRYYREYKQANNDPRPAFLWLAQVCQGRSLAQIQKWAEESFLQQDQNLIFGEQKKLIQYFLSQGIEVAIVTASVAWAVEPGARWLGVPIQNVIGVRTTVENGIVTDIANGPVTYREGKVAGLKQAFPNAHCFFAAGNTTGDLELLAHASDLRLAVTATIPGNRVHESELELQKYAYNHGWMRHSFV